MTGYSRGSEWRRWELHMHTPGTQKNDQFKGETLEEKWDKFYEDVSAYIGDGNDPLRNIEAFAVTDYLSIDNYKKVVKDNRLPKSIKFLLPNVEMRMFPIAKNAPVNIHCIFNPNVVEDLEDRFFSKLEFKYHKRTFTASHRGLMQLGRYCNNEVELSDEVAYRKGIEQFIVSVDVLQSIFEADSELRENTIIAVSNSDGDGVSGVNKNISYAIENGSQLDATKTQLYWMSDFIFSPKKSDIDYFLGKKIDNKSKIIEKYRSLKPCAHGSDAHTNESIFEPNLNRYCWIKADPTFNGLRQILYEPENRICISNTKPEVKPDYQIIDKVEIKDEDFSPDPIVFNDKLTCIIGGKSTGKSLLLNNIARTIDIKQVEKKMGSVGVKGKILSDIKVYWADGAVSSSLNKDDKHKIVYIPQTYLNRLSDEQEELTEIDAIIKDILFNNPDIKSKYIELENKLLSYKKQLDKKIYDLNDVNSSCEEQKEKLHGLGTKEGIEKEIKKLKKLKDELTEKTSLSEVDITEYDKAKVRIAKIEILIKENEKDRTLVNSLDSVVEIIPVTKDVSDSMSRIYSDAVEKVVKCADKKWIELKEDIILNLDKHKEGLRKEKETLVADVKKIEPQIEENAAVKKYSELITKEETKLIKFQGLEQKLDALKEVRDTLVEELSMSIVEFKHIHDLYANSINEMLCLSMDGLDFSVVTQFRSELFKNKICEIYDRRQLKAKDGIFGNIENITDVNITKEFTKEIILFIVDGTIKLTGKRSPEVALRDILSDWYNTAYQVKMDRDNIEEMSPGKKALVLLKMLINLAENECPILIDQPEDDLDNRSIFDELIPFIKNKKVNRQIIIVTHNANVVLGSDAEEVIIANQDGGNAKNKNYRFEYRSGSIENDIPIDIDSEGVLDQKGIQQQICDILEGGKVAFDLRRNKYRID